MSASLVSLCVAAALATAGMSPSSSVPLVGVRAAEPEPAPAPAEAVAPAPAAAPAPEPAPAPAEAVAPTPTVTLQPAPAEPAPAPTTTVVVVEPAPAPAEPAPAPSSQRGSVLITVGAISTAIGGASLLFVALPAFAVRNVAKSRADDDDALAFTSRKTRYERARRADDAMEAGFWIGAPLLVGGIAMIVAGVVARSNGRAHARLRPTLGGMAMRF